MAQELSIQNLELALLQMLPINIIWVTFIKDGLETIDIDSEFEVIEVIEDEVDIISFYEVEKSLKNLLQKWSDVKEIAPIAD